MPERSYALTELKKLREARKLTQQQLAEAAGIPISTIQKHERGVQNDAALSVAGKLATALDVPITALFDAIDSKIMLEQLAAST